MARVKVDGLRDLERALKELPRTTGKALLRRVAKKVLQPIAADMAAGAPVDPGPEGGRLSESVTVGSKLSKRQAGIHRKMFRDERASIEMFAGAGPLPEASLQEFGAENFGPQPFARPAWDAHKSGLPDKIGRELWAAVKKSAARLARKAAKGG